MGFDSLIVDSTEAERTKRCVVTLDLQLDSKWRYTINKGMSVRGYAESTGGEYRVVYKVGGNTVCVSCSLRYGDVRLCDEVQRWRLLCSRTYADV